MHVVRIAPRRLGTALLAFGIVGVALAAAVALAFAATAMTARDLVDRLADDQARLASTLEELAATTGALGSSIDNAGSTLESSSTAMVNARDVLDELSIASDQLAASLDISIFGGRPFAAAADRFRQLSAEVLVLRDDAATIAERLDTNGQDLGAMSTRVRAFETQLQDYADRIANSGRIGAIGTAVSIAGLVGGLLAAWIGVAAGACAWFGWRLRSADVTMEAASNR